MGIQNRILQIVVVVGLMLLSSAIVKAQNNTNADTDTESVVNSYLLQISIGGIGYDQKTLVSQALELIKQNKLIQAEAILDDALKQFDVLMANRSRNYVCFRLAEDYRQFLNEIEAKQGHQAMLTYTLVHYSFAQALYFKAFIASSRKQWGQTIRFLDKVISYAPYDPQPHNEKGYALNGLKKPREALESYKRAYALAVAHRDSSAKTEQAGALRGMGFAQIELGKLDDAVISFKKSLEIEPGNKVALNELQYIERVRARRR